MNPYLQDYLNHRMGWIAALICALAFLVGTIISIACGWAPGILVGSALWATALFAFMVEWRSSRYYRELMEVWDGLFGEEEA